MELNTEYVPEENKEYLCSFCNISFENSITLALHQKEIHGKMQDLGNLVKIFELDSAITNPVIYEKIETNEQVENIKTDEQEDGIGTENQKRKLGIQDQIVIYVKENDKDEFGNYCTPNTLICTPGNLYGFIQAFENKYKIQSKFVNGVFKGNSGNEELLAIDDAIFCNFANKTFKIKMRRVKVKGRKKMRNIILYEC